MRIVPSGARAVNAPAARCAAKVTELAQCAWRRLRIEAIGARVRASATVSAGPARGVRVQDALQAVEASAGCLRAGAMARAADEPSTDGGAAESPAEARPQAEVAEGGNATVADGNAAVAD